MKLMKFYVMIKKKIKAMLKEAKNSYKPQK